MTIRFPHIHRYLDAVSVQHVSICWTQDDREREIHRKGDVAASILRMFDTAPDEAAQRQVLIDIIETEDA